MRLRSCSHTNENRTKLPNLPAVVGMPRQAMIAFTHQFLPEQVMPLASSSSAFTSTISFVHQYDFVPEATSNGGSDEKRWKTSKDRAFFVRPSELSISPPCRCWRVIISFFFPPLPMCCSLCSISFVAIFSVFFFYFFSPLGCCYNPAISAALLFSTFVCHHPWRLRAKI